MKVVIQMKKEVKLTNDQNIINLKKRRVLRYIIISCLSLGIIMAFLNLILQKLIFLIVAFCLILIAFILRQIRDSIQIIKHDELEDIRKEISDNKKKFSKTEVIDKKKDKDTKPKKDNKKKNNKTK